MENPPLLTPAEIVTATDHEILIAMYQLVFASVGLFFGIAIYYCVFRAVVWFMPKFWHRGQE